MSTQQVMLSESNFLLDSAKFDGSSSTTRGAVMTGDANGKSGVFSCWCRFDTSGTLEIVFQNNTSVGGFTTRCQFVRTSSNTFSFNMFNSGGVQIFEMHTSASMASSATWKNIIGSWDLAAGVAFLYVNDSSDATVSVLTNDTIVYSSSDWSVGAASNVAFSPLTGCLAELWFAENAFLDFSVTSNRRKFITTAGKPANVGPTGLLPTGTKPIAYFHLNKGETANDFAINRGSGGNFTVTGALTTGSTSPS